MDLGTLTACGSRSRAMTRGCLWAAGSRGGTDRALVVPGGVGADLRMHGRIAGSPIEDGSGHVRVRHALNVLVRNKWVLVEQTVGELRIRLGERAKEVETGRDGP